MLALRDALCEALSLDADEPAVRRRTDPGARGRARLGRRRRAAAARLRPVAAGARRALRRRSPRWVDRTHLGERLVYYRVREAARPTRAPRHPDSLARKLAHQARFALLRLARARAGAPLRLRLLRHASTQFRRETAGDHAATARSRRGGERHEKDDRHRIDDRTRYVLGWTNEAKIAALAKQARDLAPRIASVGAEIARLRAAIAEQLRASARHCCSSWRSYADFNELDWRRWSRRSSAWRGAPRAGGSVRRAAHAAEPARRRRAGASSSRGPGSRHSGEHASTAEAGASARRRRAVDDAPPCWRRRREERSARSTSRGSKRCAPRRWASTR